MPHIQTHRSKPAMGLLLLVLATLALAACGGSSTSSTATTAATTTTTTSSSATKTSTAPASPAGGSGSKLAALRKCLKAHGVTFEPGTQIPFRGKLPPGVTRARYEATVRDCVLLPRPLPPTSRERFSTPAGRKAIAEFVACVNEHGVKLAMPRETGVGPIFKTAGLNPAALKSAEKKCRGVLASALKRDRGAGSGTAASSV